jgi:hypothetical protein
MVSKGDEYDDIEAILEGWGSYFTELLETVTRVISTQKNLSWQKYKTSS